MQHFSGFHLSLDTRTAIPIPYLAFYPGIISQDSLNETINILSSDGSIASTTPAGHPPDYMAIEPRDNYDPPHFRISHPLALKNVKLGELALARSGDKGANVNFGVFLKNDDYWPWFRCFMTRAKMQELIGDDWRDEYFIERCEFPNIKAVHFVIYGILGRGVSSSTLLDSLGKGFADYIRDKVLEVPVEVLQKVGRGTRL